MISLTCDIYGKKQQLIENRLMVARGRGGEMG